MEHNTRPPMSRNKQPLIAVVNDDEDILAMFDLALTEAGYQTLLIQQGDGAAALIREAQPALVILDIWMERIDTGVQLLRALHSGIATRTLPVIVCSAHPFMRPELAELLHEPHYVFLQKPIALDEVLSTITILLQPPTTNDAVTQP